MAEKEGKKSVQLNTGSLDKNIYNQWERRGANNTLGGKVATTNPSLRSPTTTLTVSPAPRRADNAQNRGKQYSLRQSAVEEEDAAEKLGLLEVKVMSTRAAIQKYKTREHELIKENLAMKEAIQASEKPDHESVKILMRRYEKFRGGISYLNENFTTTLETENKLLTDLENRLENELSLIHKEVELLDTMLQRRQNQVYILNHYKDKEYPVKAIRIGELMAELDQVELNNDDEFFDLERVIEDELKKLNKSGNQTETTVKESALNSVLEQMHPSLREMAKQNQVMESEINYHKTEIVQIQTDIDQLEEEVQQLIAHPKTNLRLQVFPELFKYDTKCTPDMEVVLDIPKIEILPI